MPGTVKIWWHDGATRDVRHNDMPVVNEPELGVESVAVSATPTATGPAPQDATIAIIESDVNVRYRVRREGDGTAADAALSKPLAATGRAVDVIGVAPGWSISFVEA